MNYIDYIIIALFLIGFILGFKDGFIRKLIGLAGIIVGIFLAVKFSDTAGKLLLPIFNDEPYLAGIIGSLVLFVLTVVAASIIKRLVHPHDKVNKLLNQILGGTAGSIQVIFFLSLVFLLLSAFNFPDDKTSSKSLFYKPVYSVVPGTIGFLIGGKDLVKEYIGNADEKNPKKQTGNNSKTSKK